VESPLGWLLSRGHLSRRQYDAGERLRLDYERSALAPRVTMGGDSAPVARSRGGKSFRPEVILAKIDARGRFDEAIAAAGSGLSDSLWRSGKLVLTIALDRVADYYRIR